jgi:serine/threonine-protein kinase
MASVWVARLRGRHGFEKLVATKTILPKYASDPRFRRMFLDEADIASRIEHPNVAQVFDLGEERGILYLVMEFVDGDSLSKLNRACQKKGVQIPTGVILRVLADACAGLHEAHELKGRGREPLGVVHRDISPHNILVSTKGMVKLIDFGIVKVGRNDGPNDSEVGESGVLKGKIQYMAPEQALGRPVDRRADVWAIGAILYHLVSGKAPYDGESQLAMLHLHGAGLPPPPLGPEVHPAIAAVVRKALAHDPSKRYATAAELREGIERAMAVAQMSATTSEVSAFWAQHLAERGKRRHDAIEQALATLAEKNRTEAAMAAAALVHPKPTTTASEPPPMTSSYATLGSDALDASRAATALARARKPLLTLFAFVLGFAAVTVTSMTVLTPKREVGVPAAAVSAEVQPPPPAVPPAVAPVTATTSITATASAVPIPSSPPSVPSERQPQSRKAPKRDR